MSAPLFPFGQVVATPGAMRALLGVETLGSDLLARHLRGDWGDVDAHDRNANNLALKRGERLVSSYRLDDGTRIWIITEADRTVTTILLPEEY
jgi:hypothetical protein